ncbi:MAG: aminotransferase class V-fold PLP-dependent enzyme [Acidimicrobiaceae bacterium]|nr:aminotransferase class V-fold PLP-dependent enzyme [Acidimicrobiaceae bacterium]
MTMRSTAEALDAQDPLAKYRQQFLINDPSLCYLDGNSLGRIPRETITVVENYLRHEWGTKLVSGWAQWIDEAQTVGDLIGRSALGATAGQTLCVDTTSVNFYQLCCAAVDARPGRNIVISDTANFPTDRYVLEGICKQRGLKLVLIDDDHGEEFVSTEMLAAVLSENVALVTLSVIQYRSGSLHDVAKLTKLARDAGALFVWDASHGVGVVPLQFDRDGVDLAVGCTYKYGNSGPGSPAWLYVSRAIQNKLGVPIQGWFAQEDQFEMGQGFERAPGMRGYQVASPSIVGLRCVSTAFSMIEQAGLPAIARKAAHGTELMIALHDAWLAPLGFSLVTSRDAKHRGGHITLRHPQARKISEAMRIFGNVIGDFRRPDCLRLAISPLPTSYAEVWDGFSRIRDLVATRKHDEIRESTNRVT